MDFEACSEPGSASDGVRGTGRRFIGGKRTSSASVDVGDATMSIAQSTLSRSRKNG